MNHSIRSAVQILHQLTFVLKQLSDKEFTQPLNLLSGNSIGKHCRHLIEFYTCLMEAHKNGRLNYDARKHDRKIEQNVKYTIDLLNQITTFLQSETANRNIELSYSYEKESFDTVQTNFKRELVYNIEHCVHHMAIIKIAIDNAFTHIEIPASFGIAHSTIIHNQKGCAQ